MDLKGQELISELSLHSGIESKNFDYHFSEILENYHLDPKELTLDDLREILSNYLQDLILEINKEG